MGRALLLSSGVAHTECVVCFVYHQSTLKRHAITAYTWTIIITYFRGSYVELYYKTVAWGSFGSNIYFLILCYIYWELCCAPLFLMNVLPALADTESHNFLRNETPAFPLPVSRAGVTQAPADFRHLQHISHFHPFPFLDAPRLPRCFIF